MNHTYKHIGIAALGLLLAGCSAILPSNKNRIDGSQAQKTVSVPSPNVPSSPASAAGTPGTATTPSKPADNTPATQGAPAANATSSAPADSLSKGNDVASLITAGSGIGHKLDGRWTIIQVGSTTIDRDDDMPYLIFEPATARFYGNNGCNTLNGAYSLDANDFITFHSVLSTMRYCPETQFDSEINSIVADGRSTRLRVEEIGQESFVDFLDAGGNVAMRLRRGNMRFLNGQWDIEKVAGIDNVEPGANIFIDIEEHKIHANTGCNIVNGDIYLDHRLSNAVDFSNLTSTRMACPPPFDKFQTAMLVALEETATAISDGADRVMLLGHNGQILMTLKKSSQKYDQ